MKHRHLLPTPHSLWPSGLDTGACLGQRHPRRRLAHPVGCLQVPLCWSGSKLLDKVGCLPSSLTFSPIHVNTDAVRTMPCIIAGLLQECLMCTLSFFCRPLGHLRLYGLTDVLFHTKSILLQSLLIGFHITWPAGLDRIPVFSPFSTQSVCYRRS